MTQILKADTAVKVVMGPFVDVGDGFTPEAAVTLTGGGDNADEAELLKHDNATTVDISSNTWAALSGVDGYYHLSLTAANLDTEGMLDIVIQNDSVHLPVRKSFMVVNANVYDSLYAASGTDTLDVQVAGMDASTVTAAAIATGAIDADSIATDAITNAKIAANAITPTEATVDVTQWNGSAVATPSVAGVPEVDITHIEGSTTMAELAQAAPAATPTLPQCLMLLYMALRNKLDVTNTVKEIHNDAGTVICKKTITNGASEYSEAEMASGP